MADGEKRDVITIGIDPGVEGIPGTADIHHQQFAGDMPTMPKR